MSKVQKVIYIDDVESKHLNKKKKQQHIICLFMLLVTVWARFPFNRMCVAEWRFGFKMIQNCRISAVRYCLATICEVVRRACWSTSVRQRLGQKLRFTFLALTMNLYAVRKVRKSSGSSWGRDSVVSLCTLKNCTPNCSGRDTKVQVLTCFSKVSRPM